VCLAVFPGRALASGASHHHAPAVPQITYLPHPIRVTTPLSQLPGARTSCTSNCDLYLQCLSNAPTHCLGIDGTMTIILASAIITATCQFVPCGILWKVIRNSKGDTTEEDDGTYHGKHEADLHGCLGANPTPSDGNDRGYISSPSKCSGLDRQSWVPQQDNEPGYYDWYNLHALNEGQPYQLVQNNLRNGAFEYAKREGGGTWSTWSLYFAAICHSHC